MNNVRNGINIFTFTNRSKLKGIYLLIWFGTNNAYYMNGDMYCNSKLSMVSEKVFQVKVELNDDNIYDRRRSSYHGSGSCELKIEAWYNTYHKLMFYFENLNLDCSEGHLEFFVVQNTDSRVTGLEHDVCGPNKPKGVFTVDTRFLQIKYIPRKSQQILDVFSVIITAFREDTCPRYAHKCANSRCIDEDLACNGYDSCGDGSGCNLGTGAIVGIVIGSLASGAFLIILMNLDSHQERNQTAAVRHDDFPTRDQTSYSLADDTSTRDQAPYPIFSTAVTETDSEIRTQANQEDSLPSYTALFGNNPMENRQYHFTMISGSNLTNIQSSTNSSTSIQPNFLANGQEEQNENAGQPPSYTEVFGKIPVGNKQYHGTLNERNLTRIQSSMNTVTREQPNFLTNNQEEQNETITQPPSHTQISRNITSGVNDLERPTRTILETPI
ncbi:uncharacterized protein LOC123526432 isoform X2 [Mercenaria mercenaria]|uniref:uncharacterized protein LOC123526432 isoform X2 n=1 Tax=Mercenaria mercenaria TaxID=6596 RepID=UPI00234F6BF1|nr:uncharacterized protein LOC123526432 isoform X2 [Mercenaria mercenaria]